MYITEMLEGKIIKIGDIEIKLMKIKAGRKALLLIKAPKEKPIERLDKTYIEEDCNEAPRLPI